MRSCEGVFVKRVLEAKQLLMLPFMLIVTLLIVGGMNLTVSATETDQYKLKYVSEEGYLISESEDSVEAVQYIDAGSYATLPNTMSDSSGCRPGYVITGWKIKGGDDTIYYTGTYMTSGTYLYSYHPTGDTVFVAQWAEVYEVTFESEEGYINGSENNTSIVKKVVKGNVIGYNSPSVTNHDGVAFSGWKIKNSDGTLGETLYVTDNTMDPDYINNYKPTGNVTFVAQWVEAYTITFKSEEGYINGNEQTTTQDYLVKKGGNIQQTPNASGRPNYVFVGWKVENGDDTIYISMYDGSNNPMLSSYYPVGNTTFIAVWKEAYTVTFHSDEGYMPGGYGESSTDYKLSVGKGDAITSSIYISRPGYMLEGWKLEGGDETLYANGTVYLDANTPTPTQISDTCLGGFKPDKDVIFIAVWKVAYTVTFHSEKGYIDGNPATTEKTIQVAHGYTIGTAPVGSYSQGLFLVSGCDGYGLAGWKKEGDNTLYKPYSTYATAGTSITDYVVKGNVTFEAQWEPDVTVTFLPGDESFSSGEDQKVCTSKGGAALSSLESQLWTLNYDQYVDRKVLVGWTIQGDDPGKVYYINSKRQGAAAVLWDYIPTADTTFVAKWDDAWKVTYRTDIGIMYDRNEDECKEVTYQVEKGQKIYNGERAAYYSNLEKEGYTFLGWKTEGDDKLYQHDDSDDRSQPVEHEIFDYVPKSDVEFVAQWKKNGEPDEPAPDTQPDEPASNTDPVQKEDKKDTSTSEQPMDKQPETVPKQQTTITAKSYTKTYGGKAFNIGAKTNSDGALKYTSSNNKVATISQDGRVSLKGCGKADITIEAPETDGFEAASQTVTITVLPGMVTFKKVTSPGRSQIYFSWKKMTGATKYQYCVSGNKKFKGAKKYSTKGTSVKLAPKGSSVSASGRSFYIRVRAVSKIGKKTYYGKWSKIRKVRVK